MRKIRKKGVGLDFGGLRHHAWELIKQQIHKVSILKKRTKERKKKSYALSEAVDSPINYLLEHTSIAFDISINQVLFLLR